MKSYNDYFNPPEGFNFEYVKSVMKVLYPITFAISVVMTAVSFAVIATAYFEIVKGDHFSKWRMVESMDPKVKLGLGIVMLIISVSYNKWYIVIFFPDGILNMIL